jgi:hypothetical protein
MKLRILSITKIFFVALSLVILATVGELAAQPNSIKNITEKTME